MDIMRSSSLIPKNHLEKINYFRLSIHATTLADIVSSDRQSVIPEILNREYDSTTEAVKVTRTQGPQQNRPSKHTQEIWKSKLTSTVCNNTGHLYKELGKWESNADTQRAQYNREHNALYYYSRGKWTTYNLTSIHRRYTIAEKGDQVTEPPPKSYPVTDAAKVPSLEGQITFTIPKEMKQKREYNTSMTTFKEYINTLPPWEKTLLSSIYEKSRGNSNLKKHIQSTEKSLLVTDIGLTDGLGYFGWNIGTEMVILWIRYKHAQGNPELNKSLCTEGIGYLSLLCLLFHYTKYHNRMLKRRNIDTLL
eukprot:11581189-Ditylum_brightwellii.AAC.1